MVGAVADESWRWITIGSASSLQFFLHLNNLMRQVYTTVVACLLRTVVVNLFWPASWVNRKGMAILIKLQGRMDFSVWIFCTRFVDFVILKFYLLFQLGSYHFCFECVKASQVVMDNVPECPQLTSVYGSQMVGIGKKLQLKMWATWNW